MSDTNENQTTEPATPEVAALPVMSAVAYAEEHPRLRREAKDILARLYGHDRKTEAEWTELAKTFGGDRA